MSEKRARISLAQKLDIIEASKKSGFSIEDVMKKYGLKKSKSIKINHLKLVLLLHQAREKGFR